ncbi:MAG: glycosyltransferase family 1 protein [Actinomycetota bacterium]
MRVAVNLMWCLPGAVGGSEQYLVRQLIGMLDARPDIDLTLVAPEAFVDVYRERLNRCQFVVAPAGGERRSRRVWHEHTWLHRVTEAYDLVHHGGGTAPRRARKPYVLTLHDLQYRTFPQYFSSVKRRYLDAMIPASALGAARIAVPSEYVRRSVIEHLGIAAERVRVVPHGFEPELAVAATPEAELRRRYALGDGRVLVYPAMTAPHKNHRFLIELMQHQWADLDLRLVFIGGSGEADAEVRAAMAAGDGRTMHLGRVSDADRNGLLAMAEALVFPSTYEGFGAPVIEAMALGAPVVCSDATCLPDIVGDAGLVLPLVSDAWAGALAAVAGRRSELVAAGQARAATFTARRSGEAIAAVYDEVLA